MVSFLILGVDELTFKNWMKPQYFERKVKFL